MAEDDKNIEKQFIHEIGELAGSFGLSRSVGQLYALLYMSPEPINLEKMAESCGMSKGNASMKIRELERWGAVKRVYVEGDRKDYYEANRDIPGIVINRLKSGLPRRLSTLRSLIENVESEVEKIEDDKEKKDFYQKRIKEVKRLERGVERLVNNIDRLYQMGRRFI